MKKEEKRTLEEIHRTYTEMDKRLAQAEKDIASWEECMRKFEEMRSNIAVLSSYYHSEEWLSDRELHQKECPTTYFACAGEDAIWNVETDFYQQRIEAIKLLVGSL